MNSYFSFHRIKLLAIRYIAEHGRRDLFTLSAFFLAFTFLPRLIASDPTGTSTPALFSVILFVGGMRYTARIFHTIHHPGSGMHYLHIPASRLEKFLFNGVITLLIFPLACLLLYYGGTLFGNLLAPIIPSFLNYQTIDLYSLLPKEFWGKIATQYIFYHHCIFFLGSLFFKNHPTTKTLLCTILFGLAIGIIQMGLLWLIWGGVENANGMMDNLKIEHILNFVGNARTIIFLQYLLSTLALAFFWVVSYLKFKEKQV